MEVSNALLAKCEQDRGPMLLGLSWSLLILATSVVIVRMAVRLGRNAVRWWDDYMMMFSLIFAIIGVAFLTKMIQAGVGQHTYCLPPERIPITLKWSTLAQIMNNIGIGLVKISVCLFVLRVIDRTRKSLARFLWLLIAFITLSHLVQVILFIVQCRPMAAIWDKSIEGQCFSSHITYLAGYIGFGLDALTDLTCAIIPVLIIAPLHMNTRTKVALTILTSLGVLTASCAIAKAATLHAVFSKDYTFAIVNPAICTVLEHLVGMILACAPCLRPLFQRVLDLRSTTADELSPSSTISTNRGLGNKKPSWSQRLGDNHPHLYHHHHHRNGRFSPTNLIHHRVHPHYRYRSKTSTTAVSGPPSSRTTSNWRLAVMTRRQSKQDPLRVRIGSQTSIPLYEGEIRKTTHLRVSTETAVLSPGAETTTAAHAERREVDQSEDTRPNSVRSMDSQGDGDDWGLDGEGEMRDVGIVREGLMVGAGAGAGAGGGGRRGREMSTAYFRDGGAARGGRVWREGWV